MTSNELIVPEFTKKDYIETTTPYEWLAQFKDNKLKLQQMSFIIREQAGAVGVKNFMTLYRAYMESVNTANYATVANTTNFTDQEIELDCGEWSCDDTGVSRLDKMGFEVVACNHPIMPIQRLINIDTGIEKLKLAFRKGDKWRTVIADKRTLASANAIIQLADYGVAVNSENAKELVCYLTEIEHLNYSTIKEVRSVGRLGWVGEYGFSPFAENLEFDGDLSFKHFFESVRMGGLFSRWVDLAADIRKGSVFARIVLAASLSSVLVEPCGCNPFFVHVWGGTEAGKSVSLMLAASVWADPHIGRYIHTYNSTAVAQELAAGFVNSMPLIIDELQIIKDKKDFDSTVYQLSEGVGRSRGAKAGGLQKLPTWRNCILSSGEFPLSTASSGGGMVNRIIDLNCGEEKIFTDARNVAETLKENYGFIGRAFVGMLQEDGELARARALQGEFYSHLMSGDTTEKQAAPASLILTADTLITKWLFRDDRELTVDDIAPFLATKEEVSQNARALEFLYDFVSINQNRFTSIDNNGEVWGEIKDDKIYIIKAQFDKIMSDNGYSAQSFVCWAKAQGLLEGRDGKNTTVARINYKTVRCVCLKME